MMGRRIPALARAIERQFPGTRVWVKRYHPPDGDRGIKWFVRILNCPARLTVRVDDFAIRRAVELWGGVHFPCFISAYNRRITRAHFADKIQGPSTWRSRGRARTQSVSRRDGRRREARRVRV